MKANITVNKKIKGGNTKKTRKHIDLSNKKHVSSFNKKTK